MVVDYSQPPKMVPFNGANCLDWVLQIERYFFCYFVLESLKLSLASLFIEGDAREWFRPLYRNHLFRDWDHFIEELFIRFRNGTNCLDMAASQRKVEELTNSETDFVIHQGHSNPVDNSKLLSELETPISKSLRIISFTHLEVSTGGIRTYPLESKNKEDNTSDHAFKVFAEIPEGEIDLKMDDTAINNSLTTDTQVFGKMYQSFSTVRTDSYDLVLFAKQLALPCMLFVGSNSQLIGNGIYVDLREHGQVGIVLPLHRFSLAHGELDFPFDPGSHWLRPYFTSSRNFISCDELGRVKLETLMPSTVWKHLIPPIQPLLRNIINVCTGDFEYILCFQHNFSDYLHKWDNTGQRFKASMFSLPFFCVMIDIYVYVKSSWLDGGSFIDELVETNLLIVSVGDFIATSVEHIYW